MSILSSLARSAVLVVVVGAVVLVFGGTLTQLIIMTLGIVIVGLVTDLVRARRRGPQDRDRL
ncbi:hypothetical protein [Homoserinibacter sp. YIM 151385]|uniref:hypothetical protein n=1 Tax=Homoserinibacter sp. YIM 151385 TaxID=2985506 RepID=UPI0022F0CD6D|nr:hypothetical protein [Homoserinibacter sp. YIM 151385]WBU36977.1 hypothetical protein OF852_08555 [Homoserinibacter sp. YIM 151385]